MLMSNEFVNDKHRRELLRDQFQSKSTSKVAIDPHRGGTPDQGD
jgi:hypothetical protein